MSADEIDAEAERVAYQDEQDFGLSAAMTLASYEEVDGR